MKFRVEIIGSFTMNLPVIQTHNNISFPDVEQALLEPDGLLAMGGDLSVKRLLSAYSSGIFPWFSDGEPILWWSPNPRMVLFPEYFKCSKSLKKSINNKKFQVIYNRNFLNVMKQCSKPRPLQQGTWITEEMLYAYQQLHLAGYAHSVETWLDGKLVGGLYGIAIGRVFFGESMFSIERDASKVALFHLSETLKTKQFVVIDCQVYSKHLDSLGAFCIPRNEFIKLLKHACIPADKLVFTG